MDCYHCSQQNFATVSDDKLPPKITQTVQFSAIDPDKRSREPRQAFLTVIRGGGADLGKHIVVDSSVLLGRAPDCDLTIQDLGTSWHHARVSARGHDNYVIEDLNSTNGTWVNGILLDATWTLHEGEKIFLGETVVRFSLTDEMDLKFHHEVAQLVSTDPLTGLQSKRKFDNALDYALEIARREERSLSVVMMDMDGIKKINDTHGHLFGAQAIGETGRLIARVLGQQGRACRFGGDEFTAFLPGHDKDAAVRIAEKIRLELESANLQLNSIALRPTISLGISTFPEDGRRVLDLVAAADAALYRAKRAGKNRVCT